MSKAQEELEFFKNNEFYDEIGQHYGFISQRCEVIETELNNYEKVKRKLNRWLELLKTDGCNSKLMVANDIQTILKEIKEEHD